MPPKALVLSQSNAFLNASDGESANAAPQGLLCFNITAALVFSEEFCF